MQLLNSPQLRIFDQTYSLLSDKQQFKQLLSQGLELVLEKQQENNCLSKSVLCCGCLPSESTKLKKLQELNRKNSHTALLSTREENETLFELKLTHSNETFIGSWYDLVVFEEWEDSFYNNAIINDPSPPSNTMPVMFQPSPQLLTQHNPSWYSKITLWFSSHQFRFILTDKKHHQRLFNLCTTLKSYYSKLHPESQYNSLALRHFVQYNLDKDPYLSKGEIIQLMKDLNFQQKEFDQYVEQLPEYRETGKLSQDGFMKLIEVLQCPEDLSAIFQKYAQSSIDSGSIFQKYAQKCMSQSEFNLFLKEVQQQQPQPKATTISFSSPRLPQFHSSSPPSSPSPTLSYSYSYIDFCHHIISNSKNPAIEPSDIDSSKPLAHYFVNSSHNTYLVGNQLTSMSSANVYYLNLVEGMRCVELDIHDGPEGPMIKHGYTFTAKIYFDEAMKAIMKFCIENPDHTPIILSFENHCTEQNRLKMAQTLSRIPLSKFYIIPPKGTNQDQFPSLEELKGKIIIQGTGNFHDLYPGVKKSQKKPSIKQKIKTTDLLFAFSQQNVLSMKELGLSKSVHKQEFLKKVNILQKQKLQAETVLRSIQDQLEKRNRKEIQQITRYYGMVAAPFALNNTCWQMANIAENNLLKMLKGEMTPTPEEIYQYSWSSLIRIYPFGLRFGSSNYNPIPMLQCGCQLVSLNTQNVDVYYVCVQGMFERNRQCGYVLKPDVKNQNKQTFSYRIVFMDCLDIRPRLKALNDEETCLQVSFLGSLQDMQRNFKYVNNSEDIQTIGTNQPITISSSFPSKNIHNYKFHAQQSSSYSSSTLKGITRTPYPFVDLQVSNVEFAHLYINLPHCGSMGVPLKDLRKGLRVVPVYRFEIGRKKTMGHLLVWTEISLFK